jgi:hypothetical protein
VAGGNINSEEECPWDRFAHALKVPGVLVKGLYIVEFVDESGRALRYVMSPDMSQWDLLGFLNSVLLDIQSERMAMQLIVTACEEEDTE